MRAFKLVSLVSLLGLGLVSGQAAAAQCGDVLNHSMQQLRTKETVDLCESYQDKTLLIVNTASKCGFTPQFKALQALSEKYASKGLVVLASRLTISCRNITMKPRLRKSVTSTMV